MRYATRTELYRELAGVSGGGVSDGDKGDVVVSGAGSTWTLDAAVSAKLVTNGDAHNHLGGDGGQIALTSLSGGNWKVVYTNGSATVVELALGASGTALTSNGASSAPTFTNPYGKGIVVVEGAPSGGSDNTVLNAAIAAAGTMGTVYLPPGTWRTSGGLTTIAVDGVRIVGAGRFTTFLRLDATADGQAALTVDDNTYGGVYRFQLEDLTITTGTSDYNKIGLKLINCAETRIHNVNITGFNDTGTDSVGLWTQGREALWCSDMEIGAVIPIYIAKNTLIDPGGYISFDHFTFNNMQLTASDTAADLLHKAVVLVQADGTHGYNLQFTGSQAWIMGGPAVACDGFWWDYSASSIPGSYCGNLAFNNVRTEQGTADPTKWSFYITAHNVLNYELRNVSWTNCNINAASEGIYARNVKMMSFRDCNLSQVSGRKIIDADGFRSLIWDNVWTKASGAGSVNVNGATQQFAMPLEAGHTHPNSAVWGEGGIVPSQPQILARSLGA